MSAKQLRHICSRARASVPAYPVQNALTGALRRTAATQGRTSHLSLWAGQGVGTARALPAGELVAVLAEEWRLTAASVAAKAI